VATSLNNVFASGRAPVPQLLSEELFDDALVRERKRADRFEEPFILFLLTIQGPRGRESWKLLIEALSQSAQDTDVIGWFRQDTVVGLVRPIVGADATEEASSLAVKIRRALGRRGTSEGLQRCSLHWEVYSPSGASMPSAVIEAERRRAPQQTLRNGLKRALDVVGSTILLIALAPIFAILSAIVKLTSKGPVFFPQERVGADGRPFKMVKFRTMHANADPSIHQRYVEEFIRSSSAARTGEQIFKIVNDPRVTPVGHFLRRSSLDELPQFWNVLKGEMSLVGPRPPLPYEVARYKSWHKRRLLEAKPGITGAWQVNGRSRTTFEEMVRLDLRYARSHSVWTDLKIIAATPKAMISGKGAH
jgi:lipopolysaccharide/colanic/teichoic acid biosynthesis glycosyltransferase